MFTSIINGIVNQLLVAVFLYKSIVPLLVKKFPAYCGETWRFIIVFTNCCHLTIMIQFVSPRQFIPVFKIHFNIILPSMSGSSKWPFSFTLPNQIRVGVS